MGNRITYVGLDVHKETIVVPVAEGGIRGEIREYGRIANTPTALDRVMRKLGREGVRLRFCYERGRAATASSVNCRRPGMNASSSRPR